MKIIKSNTIFYHSSYNFNKLKYGYLTFFSSRIDYASTINNLLKTGWCTNCLHNRSSKSNCCTYDKNSPVYKFTNNQNLNLYEIYSEFEINFLMLTINQSDLIYFLYKNNLDGFITYKSVNKKGIVYLLLTNKKIIQNNKICENVKKKYILGNNSINYVRWLISFLLFTVIFIPLYIKIKKNILFHKKMDKLEFINKKSLTLYKQNINKLNIISFNIHYFRNVFKKYKYNNLICFIKKYQPNILCLQEVFLSNYIIDIIYFPSKNTFFKDLQNIGYNYIKWDKNSGLLTAIKSNNQLIVNKYKLIKFEDKDKACLLTIINYNNKIIHIYNLHLNVKSENIRFQQFYNVFLNINKNNNNIILGDFNSLTRNDYSNNTFQNMIIQKRKFIPNIIYLTNFINKYFIDCIIYKNNNSTNNTSFFKVRVDYIFISKSLENNNNKLFVLDDVVISDHYPLLFEF